MTLPENAILIATDRDSGVTFQIERTAREDEIIAVPGGLFLVRYIRRRAQSLSNDGRVFEAEVSRYHRELGSDTLIPSGA